jgi:hypothetical protein
MGRGRGHWKDTSDRVTQNRTMGVQTDDIRLRGIEFGLLPNQVRRKIITKVLPQSQLTEPSPRPPTLHVGLSVPYPSPEQIGRQSIPASLELEQTLSEWRLIQQHTQPQR